MATYTYEQFKEKLDKWWRLVPEEAWKAVSRAAALVVAEVQRGHLSGKKMPRGVGGTTEATLAVVTNRLRGSIWHSVKRPSQLKQGEQITARIGTNVKYARIHEYGGVIRNAFGRGQHRMAFMPMRPFLRPSLSKEQPRALKLILDAMMRSYNKAGGGMGGLGILKWKF